VLYKCANPTCPSLFRRLSQGKLFQVETTDSSTKPGRLLTARRKGFVRQIERFWLCDRCSRSVTIAYENGRGIVTVPLPAITDKLAVMDGANHRTIINGLQRSTNRALG
jgi:hypothetical protein